jgi:hypothetical protein
MSTNPGNINLTSSQASTFESLWSWLKNHVPGMNESDLVGANKQPITITVPPVRPFRETAVENVSSRDTQTQALDRLDKILRRWFHEPDMQAIRIVMASIKSHYLDLGDPAWLFVVAPPGSGKTTTSIMGAAGLDQVHTLGDFTENTLLSGFYGHREAGLLEKLGPATEEGHIFTTEGNGILLCKDFTTVLSMRRERRAAILSQLREIHDGQFRRDFGTGETKIWKGRITVIAAVTPVLDRHYSMFSVLGERFLQVRWHRPHRVAGEYAIDQQTQEQGIRQEIVEAVKGVFDAASTTPPQISDSIRQRLAALSELVAVGRTHVFRNNYGNREIEYIPEPEANTRIAKGLAAIARGAAALRSHSEVCEDDLRDTYRVALDCLPDIRRHLFLAAIRHENPAVTQRTTLERQIEELKELGLLAHDSAPTLSEMAMELVNESQLAQMM